MIQTFVMCTVWSGPLSQTAQSFMPELIYGAKRSLEKVNDGFFNDATLLTWFYQFLYNHVLTYILLMNDPFEVPIPDSLSFDSIYANSLSLSLSLMKYSYFCLLEVF